MMNGGMLADLLNFRGTLFVANSYWVWMAVSFGLGAWVGWRTAAEAAPGAQGEDAR